MKRKIKGISALVLAMVLMVVIVPSAFADSSLSDPTYKTVNGYKYKFWSVVANTVPGKMFAQTTLTVENADEVPTGYMGAQARLYNSSGVLKNSTDWIYNESSSGALLALSNFSHSSGYFYSKGQVKLYNGNGYSTYSCASTPNYAPTFHSVQTVVQVNEKGEVYGSEYFLNQIRVQPDLVLAEGNDGTVGYVKAKDIETADIETPEEAIAYEANRTAYTVPLYASDGETVIGSFTVM